MNRIRSAARPGAGSALALVALCAACGPQPVPAPDATPPREPELAGLAPRVEPLASPAPAASVGPRLAAGVGRETLLAWSEPAGEGRHRLRVARLDAEGGVRGAVRTAAEGARWFVNWADVPPVVAGRSGGRILASWLERSGDEAYAYEVRLALAEGEEGAFESRGRLHADATPAEHGFVSLVPLADNQTLAFWLDGAKTPAGGPTALRAALVDRDGRPREEWELDPRVCDCCPTAAAVLPDGSVGVLYRDRSEGEVRDVSLVRVRPEEPGRATPPRTVHVDGWVMPGCPVNGPALDAAGRSVLAAWTTEAGGRPRVLLARSTDSGTSFEPPLVVAGGDEGGRPLGRVALAFLRDGSALVAWLEVEDEEARWLVRRIEGATRPGGALALSPAATIAPAPAGRAAGRLALVRAQDGALAAWPSDEGVRLARLLP